MGVGVVAHLIGATELLVFLGLSLPTIARRKAPRSGGGLLRV
jgi:hypothetical protein